MNANFETFKARINAEHSALRKSGHNFTPITQSQIIERAMRCGIEARVFAPLNDAETEEIAFVTLRQDQIKYKAQYLPGYEYVVTRDAEVIGND